jgi:hypothetical protein
MFLQLVIRVCSYRINVKHVTTFFSKFTNLLASERYFPKIYDIGVTLRNKKHALHRY